MKMLFGVAVAAAFITACSESPTATATPQFAKGGGNPHQIADATGCDEQPDLQDATFSCRFKYAGLAKNSNIDVLLTVDAVVQFTCRKEDGSTNNGHSDKVRIGTGSATYNSGKNGQVTGTITALLDWNHGHQPLCPTPWILDESSVVTLADSWSLSAAGQNQGGSW